MRGVTMKIWFDLRSANDYRKFLAVRRLPMYRFEGSAAVVPDEYAAAFGAVIRVCIHVLLSLKNQLTTVPHPIKVKYEAYF